MAKHVLVVLTNPKPGRDQEFNDWYDNIHVPEVLELPGFLSAQRYKVGDAQLLEPPAHQYLALYEFEANSLGDVPKTFMENAAKMRMTDALDPASAKSWIYTVRGPRQTRKA